MLMLIYWLQEMLNQSLAKAVFVSGSPLSLVEHLLMACFFQKLRLSYRLPLRLRMSSTYLDAQYTELQGEINKQLKNKQSTSAV